MKDKIWTKNFTIIIVINFLMYVGYNILIATLPLHIKNIGGNPTQIGLVVSLFALAALISRPIAGNILDNYGRKKILAIVFIIITIISALFSIPFTIVTLLIIRFAHGFFWGISSTATASLTSDVTPKQLRSEAWGYFAFASSLAVAVGSIMGSFFMGKFSFSLTALLVTFLLIICFILSRLINYPDFQMKKKGERNKLSLSSIFEKNALFPALLAMLLMMTSGFVMAFIMVYGKQIGVNAGLFFVGFAAMILVSKIAEKELIKNFGHESVLIAGSISVILALIILSFANGPIAMIISSLLYGFGYGTIAPSLQAWAVNASPKERTGAANATYLASVDVGIAIGSSLFGMISAYTGLALAYRLCSLCMVIFLILYGLHLFHQNKNTNKQETEEQDEFPKVIEE